MTVDGAVVAYNNNIFFFITKYVVLTVITDRKKLLFCVRLYLAHVVSYSFIFHATPLFITNYVLIRFACSHISPERLPSASSLTYPLPDFPLFLFYPSSRLFRYYFVYQYDQTRLIL